MLLLYYMLIALRYWIILAVVITGTCGIIYLAVQQDIRLSANDPQIELLEDLGGKLQNGANPKTIVSGGQIDLSKSLATFVIVFNEKKEVVVSNAVLDGKAPTLPSGVDRKSTRLNSSHQIISYAVFCLKKKNKIEYNKERNSM